MSQKVAVNHQLEFRPYQEEDEAEIAALFKLVFGREIPLKHWYWRFRDNPAAPVSVELAWDGDTLVAQYATSPVYLTIEGIDQLTHLSLGTMTHPAYRGRGIMERLATNHYEKLTRQGVSLVWGFPNAHSHLIFVRRLNWFDISEVVTMVLVLSADTKALRMNPNVVRVNSFDHRFDDLWQRMHTRHLVQVRRDSSYLNWRYLQCPTNRYTVFVHMIDDRVKGYAVCKLFIQESGRYADLVDLLAEDFEEAGFSLVTSVIDWAHAHSCISVNTWMNVHHPMSRLLEEMNFRSVGPRTYFGGHILGNNLRMEKISDFRNWYLTMGDSDVY